MIRFALLIVLFIIPFSLQASSINLICEDKRTYGFRDESVFPEEWGEETFNNIWIIQYDGVSDQALIDNKPVTAIKGNGTVILVDYTSSLIGQSLWAFAVHLGERKVTAAQVNAYEDPLGLGIKSRSVQFSCESQN